jgi:hypothetical protein
MMSLDIPPSILKRHPELVAVGEALEQRRRGEPVVARCGKCGALLEVEEVVATGAVVVRCPKGDTFFRAVHGSKNQNP